MRRVRTAPDRVLPPHLRHRLLGAATIVYLGVVASITLLPTPYGDEAGVVLQALLDLFALSPVTAWLTFDVVEFLANVALFVPLGALFCLLAGGRRPLILPVVAAFTVSLAIEASQAFWLPTRVADVRDLVSNGLGGTIGTALVLIGSSLLARRRRARSDDAGE